MGEGIGANVLYDEEYLTPSTLDVDQLLEDVTPAKPAGEDIAGQEAFFVVEEAYKTARRRARQEGQDGLGKNNDWSAVFKAGAEVLEKQSKDLRIAIWMCEALVRHQGFAGLRDGLYLLGQLQEKYWNSVYPVGQEGLDMRRSLLASLDDPLVQIVTLVPFLHHGDKQYSWWDWDSALNRKEGSVPIKELEEAKAATSLEDWEAIFADLSQCLEESAHLEEVMEEKFNSAFQEDAYLVEFMNRKGLDPNNAQDRQKAVRTAQSEIPQLTGVKDVVKHCLALAEEAVREKRGRNNTPPPVLEKPNILSRIGNALRGGGKGLDPHPGTEVMEAVQSVPLEPKNRVDALLRLEAVAEYFRKAEPHSPVPYLIHLAIQWENMPLDKWATEVIKEKTVLEHIREILGLQEQKTET